MPLLDGGPGGAMRLPSTLDLFCPVCGTGAVVLNPTIPQVPLDCLGCGKSWLVYVSPTEFYFHPVHKEAPGADTPAS